MSTSALRDLAARAALEVHEAEEEREVRPRGGPRGVQLLEGRAEGAPALDLDRKL